MWDFADRPRSYRTLKSAVEACERNEKLWQAAIELGKAEGRRLDRLMTLRARGRVGGGDILGDTPLWAEKKIDPVLLRMLHPQSRAAPDDDDCDDVPVVVPPEPAEKPAKPKATKPAKAKAKPKSKPSTKAKAKAKPRRAAKAAS